jgi:Protein of unknown function (DUF4244)
VVHRPGLTGASGANFLLALPMKLFHRIAQRVKAIGTVDVGMSTAEYAVGTVAAVAFAVVLYKIVRSPAVSSTLASVIQSALHAL